MITINGSVMKFVQCVKKKCMITFNNEFINFFEKKTIKLLFELHEKKTYFIKYMQEINHGD